MVASLEPWARSLWMFEQFRSLVAESSDLALETLTIHESLDRYRQARISRRRLAWGLVASVVAAIILICGVLLPMAQPTAPLALVAWLPAGVYVTGALVLIAFLTRKLIAARSGVDRRKDGP